MACKLHDSYGLSIYVVAACQIQVQAWLLTLEKYRKTLISLCSLAAENVVFYTC